jgi:hypothetical protein
MSSSTSAYNHIYRTINMCITIKKGVVHNHPEQHYHQSSHLHPPLAQHPCDYHYKQRSPQPPLQEPESHSVFTVEMGSRKLPTGLQHHRDSQPLYQEIGERINDGSDSSENRRDSLNKSVRHDSDKLYGKRSNGNGRNLYLKTKGKKITKPLNSKPNIVYGVITATVQALYSGYHYQARNNTVMVAKYRPCT